MWKELIDVLNQICNVYDKLANIGERKRDALVVVDMAKLSKILDEEQLAASQIEKLEKRRGEILQEFYKANTSINQATKAEDFYKTAPTIFIANTLINLHRKLTKNVERTLKIRDNNQILAQAALDAVNFHLNRLSGAAVEPTYGRTGGGIVTHRKKLDFQA